MPWTLVKSYSITQRALEAWVNWRFAAALKPPARGAVEVKVKDGDYIVYTPEELSTVDKRALKEALKNKDDWYPPLETWEQWNGAH